MLGNSEAQQYRYCIVTYKSQELKNIDFDNSRKSHHHLEIVEKGINNSFPPETGFCRGRIGPNENPVSTQTLINQ